MTSFSHNKAIAIIPARSGSKGLPGKNIMDLCGKPLIAYTIEAALKARTVDRVIVSTESEDIAAVARQWGAEVPFLRPEELARDDSQIGQVLAYTFDRLFRRGDNNVKRVIMYPTSPFRTPGLIDFMVNKAGEGIANVHTVRPIPRPRLNYFTIDNGQPRPLIDQETLAGWQGYVRNYAVVTVTHNILPQTNYVYSLEDEAAFIDIDTLEDFLFAEEVIRAGLFDFDALTPPVLHSLNPGRAA